jgi:transposase
MGRAALKVENYSSEDLKALLRKDEKFQQGVRLYACYQVSKGKKPKDLEAIYETSFKSVCNWVNKLNKGGIEALVDREKPGRRSKLSEAQKASIKDLVLTKSPDEYGYNSSTWTGLLLIDWIKNSYEIEYKKAQIYNILKALNLTFQKGKGIYPKAVEREEKIEALKKNFRKNEKIRV